MRMISKIIAVILFIVFFGLALKNTQETALYFFWGYEIRGPLVLLLLCFFAAGSVLGVLAMVPTLFRNRRELTRQKKMIASLEEQAAAKEAPPPPVVTPDIIKP